MNNILIVLIIAVCFLIFGILVLITYLLWPDQYDVFLKFIINLHATIVAGVHI